MKNKGTATLLAFFLGGMGGHKFYLGYSGQGFLYFLFCWTLIPSFIALFEGIALAMMSEDAFNKRFNATALAGNAEIQKLKLEVELLKLKQSENEKGA